jgi:glycosyltransferase involved in cell wall biosynthesis/2-polyprenyl-3-methyl-5-hydroxy-6-metoxy-1,4-benzoquinol methylase
MRTADRKIRVLHIEVGGSYGGSLRALEVYLAHSDRSRFEHDLLLYYPTPRAERIARYAGRLWSLCDRVPTTANSRHAPGRLLIRRLVSASIGPRAWANVVGLRTFLSQTGLGRNLIRHLRRVRYDLVHVNNTFTYQPWALLAARSARTPVVAHVRNPVADVLSHRALAHLASSLVTVNRTLETSLRRWGTPVPIHTVYDGVEPLLPDQAASRAWRASIVPDGALLVGSAGRLDAQKGYDNLVRAAGRIVAERPDVHFAIAGEGPEHASLEALVNRLGLAGRFHLCGFQADIANVLSAFDVFVSSSRWEGLPLVVIEAMLLGIPVIATDVGGTREVVVPDRTGDLVPACDADALASAISALLFQPDAARTRANMARDVATALSDPVANARALDDLLAGVLDARDSSTRAFYELAYAKQDWARPPVNQSLPGDRFTKMWYRAFVDHVLPITSWRGAAVLEVGCGYGYLAPLLCRLGATYVGTDISLNAVRQVPGVEGSSALVADGYRLPFPSAIFDRLVCMEVLEHVPDPNNLLDECVRVVRPGGILVISCPSYLNLFLIPKVLADLGVPTARRYMRRQLIDRTTTAVSVRRLLSRHGTVRLQRAVRLHPPLLEQFDYRWPDNQLLCGLNDLLFAAEWRWGSRPPLNYLGLHTLFVVEIQPQAVDAEGRISRSGDLNERMDATTPWGIPRYQQVAPLRRLAAQTLRDRSPEHRPVDPPRTERF